MVLIKYFLKRFFKYIFAIGFFLAFLINFIEFFEKIVRAKDAGLGSILTLVALNFVPSFFDLLGVSCWLATCLLIKEFYQQNEWEAFSLLNISYNNIIKLFIGASFLLTIFSFTVRESLVEKLTSYSEQYKMEKFKQKAAQKLLGKWLMLNKETIAYFGVLDLSTNSGTDMLMLYLNSDFTIKKVLNSKEFYIVPEKQELYIPVGLEFDIENNVPETINNLRLIVPTLFSQIKINMDVPTISNICQSLLNKSILPVSVQNELIYDLISRVISYLKLMLYPVLTYMLFVFFGNFVMAKWVAIFVPYVLFTFVSLLTDYLFAMGINPLMFLFIYLFIVIFMFCIHRRIMIRE
jgi:lipopolysaccharide export LptBFGC system permease protein LptF